MNYVKITYLNKITLNMCDISSLIFDDPYEEKYKNAENHDTIARACLPKDRDNLVNIIKDLYSEHLKYVYISKVYFMISSDNVHPSVLLSYYKHNIKFFLNILENNNYIL